MSEKENIFSRAHSDIDWMNYSVAEHEANLAKENEEKFLKFKERISKFDDIVTLEDAKFLAKQILPTAQELSQFKVGLATCTIINKTDMLRISLDSEKEFICYDFV